MAHIRDIRRMTTSAMVVTGVLLMWHVFLRLQASGDFEWFLPRRALDTLTLAAWTWILVIFLAVMSFIGGFLVYAIPVDAQNGRAIGSVRQLQCQACRAVFRMTDKGTRPLTHTCPNCHAYGVYDGTVPPVGEPPVPENLRSVKRLDLTCKNCAHTFPVTDTGARPLRVQCVHCEAMGTIR